MDTFRIFSEWYIQKWLSLGVPAKGIMAILTLAICGFASFFLAKYALIPIFRTNPWKTFLRFLKIVPLIGLIFGIFIVVTYYLPAMKMWWGKRLNNNNYKKLASNLADKETQEDRERLVALANKAKTEGLTEAEKKEAESRKNRIDDIAKHYGSGRLSQQSVQPENKITVPICDDLKGEIFFAFKNPGGGSKQATAKIIEFTDKKLLVKYDGKKSPGHIRCNFKSSNAKYQGTWADENGNKGLIEFETSLNKDGCVAYLRGSLHEGKERITIPCIISGEIISFNN